jgi:hypothetical protein
VALSGKFNFKFTGNFKFKEVQVQTNTLKRERSEWGGTDGWNPLGAAVVVAGVP